MTDDTANRYSTIGKALSIERGSDLVALFNDVLTDAHESSADEGENRWTRVDSADCGCSSLEPP